MQKKRVGFEKGLNRDFAKNKFPEGYYSYLLNGRLISTVDSTTFDITNLKGNMNANITLHPSNPSLSRVGFIIIGYTTILNNIILFFAEETASGTDNYNTTSYIDILEYQGNDAYLQREIWGGIGMNFRVDKPIEAVSRFENKDLQKIYWCDDNENVRSTIITEDISSYIPTNFDLIGNFRIDADTAPVFNRYTSGNKKPGINYYSYRFVKKHGQTTIYSPLSNGIAIANKIDSKTTQDIKGDDIYNPDKDYNATVGIEMQLNLSPTSPEVTFYDYIEVVSIWYSSKTGVPDISVIYKGPFKERIIDDGIQSYGTIDYGDFLAQQQDFSAKTITIKDDRLFLGNIKEKYFDIDEEIGNYWDARAYRFSNNGLPNVRSQLLNADLTLQTTLDQSGNFNTVPEEADCVNIYNNITANKTEELNSYGLEQKYQIDGITIGGTGLNISYEFQYRNIDFIDSTIPKESFDNLTFTNDIHGDITRKYNLGHYKAHQRDEVYRYGIVFFDTIKGRTSFTKWIGDIRIPGLHLYDSTVNTQGMLTSPVDLGLDAHLLVPKFSVSNIPIVNGRRLNYQIVKVKRELADKSVQFAGIVTPMMFAFGLGFGRDEAILPSFRILNLEQWTALYFTGIPPEPVYPEIDFSLWQLNLEFFYDAIKYNYLELRSPEISFTNTKFNPDYLEIAGVYNKLYHKIYNKEGGNWKWNDTYECDWGSKKNFAVTKYHGIINSTELINSTFFRKTVLINELVHTIQNPSGEAYIKVGEYNIKTGTSLITANFFQSDIFKGTLTKSCIINTLGALVSFDEEVGAIGSTKQSLYVYARKNVFESQYGGLSYEDRSQNIYIVASNIVNGSSIATIAYADRGDTFVKSVVNRRVSAIAKGGAYDDAGIFSADKEKRNSLSDDVIYDCESSINVDLKYNTDYFEEITSPIEDSLALTMIEMGTVSSDTGYKINALCKYNDVYSHEDTTFKFFVKPLLFEHIKEFTVLVKYSNRKLNNEDYDSWLQFRPNNNYGLDTTYGPLNKLVEFNNMIFTFQDSSFGMLNINPNAIVNSTEGEISLGTGAVIQKVQYLTTTVGCQDNSDVIKSKSALYWLCKNNKKLYTYNGKLESVSDIKGLHSYLYNVISEESVLKGVYDVKNSEVIMTVYDTIPNTIFNSSVIGTTLLLYGVISEQNVFIPGQTYKIGEAWYEFIRKSLTYYEFSFIEGIAVINGTDIDLSDYIIEKDNFTVAYNEIIQGFTSFYSFIPTIYIKNNVGYFTSNNNRDLWQHDISNYFNEFYNIQYPLELSFILNYLGQYQGEFTNLMFFNEIKDYEGNYLRNETISNIQVRNNYQESPNILLYPMTLPEDHLSFQRNTYDTSGLKIGREWYTGILNINTESIIVFNNEIYRSLIDNNTGNPISNPGDFELCELCNIRKTVEFWATQIPRFVQKEGDYINYPTSDRIRSDWAEVTLKFKDIVNPNTLREKQFKISDISIIKDVVLTSTSNKG